MSDERLFTLSKELDRKITAFDAKRLSPSWTDARSTRELQKFATIERKIMKIPANSVAGLAVKARLLLWMRGGDASDVPTSDIIAGDDLSVVDSLVLDILRIENADQAAPKRMTERAIFPADIEQVA